jgi:hypothetical protein
MEINSIIHIKGLIVIAFRIVIASEYHKILTVVLGRRAVIVW